MIGQSRWCHSWSLVSGFHLTHGNDDISIYFIIMLFIIQRLTLFWNQNLTCRGSRPSSLLSSFGHGRPCIRQPENFDCTPFFRVCILWVTHLAVASASHFITAILRKNISFELFHNSGPLLIQFHLNYADSTVVDWHKAQITFINMVDDGIAKYEHIKTILRLSKNILGGGTSSIKLSQQKRMAITLSVKPLFNLDIQWEPLRHYIKV